VGGVNGCSNTAILIRPFNSGSGGGWDISNDGTTGGTAKAFMTLTCDNLGVFTTVFKGSKTLNIGATDQELCGTAGFAFNSTCGRNDSCSLGED
jgi:hypothetical protein